VYRVSPHNFFFTSASNNNVLTFFISVLLRRFAVPFNCGVCGTIVSISISLFLHYCITVLFIYSLLLSQRIFAIFKFHFASTMCAKSFSFSTILFLLLSKYTIVKCVKSSRNQVMIKCLYPSHVSGLIGPHRSVCINCNSLFALTLLLSNFVLVCLAFIQFL